MDNNFVLAPALVTVRFDLDPVSNALQSLRMLNDLERLSGLHDWLTRTQAALSPERQSQNRMVFVAFEPLLFLPAQKLPSFPAFLDYLARLTPVELIAKQDEYLADMYTHYPEHMAQHEQGVTFRALLTDREHYVRFMTQLEELDEPEFWNAAYDLTRDPAVMQQYVVEHLRFMWETHLRAEWERQLPLLTESINAFRRIDFTDKTALEAARIVTNRDLRELLEKKLLMSNIVEFVPNPHLGPYVSVVSRSGYTNINFGVRLPRGAQSTAQSEFSRAELLIRLNALADDARLQILELLTQHDELCAQDIIEKLGVSQSTVSRHLSQLRATGYIIERRREVAKCYSLNTDRVVDTLRALTNFLSRQ